MSTKKQTSLQVTPLSKGKPALVVADAVESPVKEMDPQLAAQVKRILRNYFHGFDAFCIDTKVVEGLTLRQSIAGLKSDKAAVNGRITPEDIAALK